MFQTPKVSAFVQNVSFQGKDELKKLRVQFYVTPITYDLAMEISPHIADRLFRKAPDGNWNPAPEIPSIRFDLGNIPLQAIEFHPADDDALDHTGVLVSSAQISGIAATKLFPDNPDFTLMFHAEMTLDSLTCELARKYFKRVVFITMADLQGELFPDADVHDTTLNPQCEFCEDRATFRCKEMIYYCQKDVRRATTEVVSIVTKETPAQAEKRILAERERTNPLAKVNELIDKANEAKDALNQPELVMGGTMTPIPDKDDASYINRKRGGKRRERVN